MYKVNYLVGPYSNFFKNLIELFPDDDEEEEEGEDEIVGTEPKLKYERLSSDLKTILADDSASAIAVHPKFMVLGKLDHFE